MEPEVRFISGLWDPLHSLGGGASLAGSGQGTSWTNQTSEISAARSVQEPVDEEPNRLQRLESHSVRSVLDPDPYDTFDAGGARTTSEQQLAATSREAIETGYTPGPNQDSSFHGHNDSSHDANGHDSNDQNDGDYDANVHNDDGHDDNGYDADGQGAIEEQARSDCPRDSHIRYTHQSGIATIRPDRGDWRDSTPRTRPDEHRPKTRKRTRYASAAPIFPV